MRGLAHRRGGSLHLFDARARKNYERVFDYLAGLARAAGGIAAATNAQLAGDLGFHEATAQRAIAYLLAADLIERRRTPNGDTYYRVFEVNADVAFPPRFNGRKRRRRGIPRPILKLLSSAPRTPDKVFIYARRRARSASSADALTIAGELKRYGVAQPAVIRAAAALTTPETLASWMAYAERAPQVRSRRGYVAALAARGARLWPNQLRLAASPANGGPSRPGLNGAPPGRRERAKMPLRPELGAGAGATFRRLAQLAASLPDKPIKRI